MRCGRDFLCLQSVLDGLLEGNRSRGGVRAPWVGEGGTDPYRRMILLALRPSYCPLALSYFVLDHLRILAHGGIPRRYAGLSSLFLHPSLLSLHTGPLLVLLCRPPSGLFLSHPLLYPLQRSLEVGLHLRHQLPLPQALVPKPVDREPEDETE